MEHFLARQRETYPEIKGMTGTALRRLEQYSWPGNVRELQGLVERMVVIKRSGWIDESDLPIELAGTSAGHPPAPTLPPEGLDLQEVVSAYECDLIRQALDATGWNKNRAAQLLKLKRTTLVEKIRSKQIEPL